MAAASSPGPLDGIRIVEFSGIGPLPYACMLLADMGAEILRIERAKSAGPAPGDPTSRGRLSSIWLDLKQEADLDIARQLMDQADVAVEGFRPGVMERLGLGPRDALSRNPRLVYGRMTGWGQSGPLAQKAGHDINYISLSGALASIGPRGDKPVPPLNLVGDYAGGSLFLVMGILAALLERTRSGFGQVIDAAICDGVASLMAFPSWFAQRPDVDGREARGENVSDGGRFFYNCYQCADGEYVAVGPVEPKFYAQLLEGMRVANDPAFAAQSFRFDGSQALIERAEAIFRTRTRAEWCAIFEKKDACVTPVLKLSEVAADPHNIARGIYRDQEEGMQPAPAPRFDRTPGDIRASGWGGPCSAEETLSRWTQASARKPTE